MRRIYTVVAGLLLAAVVVQFYFAAVGAFAKPQTDSSYALHSINGMMVIGPLSLLATLFAALAKAPGRQIGFAALPFALVIVQMLIIALGQAFNTTGDRTTPIGLAIMGLHALNGMAIAGVAGGVFANARALARKPAEPRPDLVPDRA
jgi:hypothetical protein